MITADQIVVHLIGDYCTQSDWMAINKVKAWFPAIVHALVYSVPFSCLTNSPTAWLVIFGTHAIIDRYRLARYVVWAKNWLGPTSANLPWSQCQKTGYPPDRPDWLTVWLLIVADNIINICINGVAIKYL